MPLLAFDLVALVVAFMALAPLGGCRRGAPMPTSVDQTASARPATADGSVAAPAPPPRGTQITLAYASNLLAEYEQCGCPVHPTGGLARRATKLDEARAQADAVLMVDAGDLLLPSGPLSTPSGKPLPARGLDEVTRRAHLLLAALSRMGLAAFTPGEHDLAIGPTRLRRLLAEHHIPVVSANLYDDQQTRLFDADRLLVVAGVRIGIFGVTRLTSEDAALWEQSRIEARDAAAAARAEIASLRARGAAIVIALIHAGAYPEAQEILRAAPGIDWAVLGHSAMNFEMPDEVGTARALEAMSGGRDFGRLDLHVIGGDAGHFTDRGQHAQLQAILDDHARQVGELRERAEREPPILQGRTADRIAKLDKAMVTDRALLAAHPAQIHGSWFENRIVPLDAEIADQPEIAALVAAYNRESQRRAAAGLPAGLAPTDSQ